MTVESVLTRARELGITLTLNGDRIRYSPKSVPPDFLDELRQYKAQVIERLQRTRCCRACVCDAYDRRTEPNCPACQSNTCATCEGCIRASLLWRESEACAVYAATPLPDLLSRLKVGITWLTERYEASFADPDTFDADVFGRWLAEWDYAETALRGIHGYGGCIFDDCRCPDDAPIRCSMCAKEGG